MITRSASPAEVDGSPAMRTNSRTVVFNGGRLSTMSWISCRGLLFIVVSEARTRGWPAWFHRHAAPSSEGLVRNLRQVGGAGLAPAVSKVEIGFPANGRSPWKDDPDAPIVDRTW